MVRMGYLTPCRTFPQMTFQTLPARQPSSMTQSSLSGQYPDGVAIVFLFFSHQFLYCFFLVSFSDAKKKLRLALCSADSVAFPIMTPATTRNGLPDHMESEGGPGLVWLNCNLMLRSVMTVIGYFVRNPFKSERFTLVFWTISTVS